MHRVAHGSTSPPNVEVGEASTAGANGGVGILNFANLPPVKNPTPFTYLFEELSNDDAHLLPQTDTTLADLAELGKWMRDEDDSAIFNSAIPAAYTYLAQFLNHDIAFTDVQKPKGVTDSMLLDEMVAPWSKSDIFQKVANKRASFLDLDCVYGRMANGDPAPRDAEKEDKLAIGKVTAFPGHARPKGKDDDNDLVRGPKSQDKPKEDRTALIADARNDSNLILSQLHVAFIRAHNAIVEREKCTFEEARLLLQMHYHWLIVHDFLPRIVTRETIALVLDKDKRIYRPGLGLPFEFSVAAFRFGHSMIRRSYYLNDNFQGETLARLFTLIVLSNSLKPRPGEGFLTLPEHRIIQWRKFLADGRNRARAFRTQMVEPLFELLDEADMPVKGEARLSVQDLKRGYMMCIPTGQAIANHLGLTAMTAPEIEGVAANADQSRVLKRSHFSSHTPLWFYILAEAAHAKTGLLGPVGGRIVAEVLIGLIANIPHSFLNTGWVPLFGARKNQFELSDLLRLGGVLENP